VVGLAAPSLSAGIDVADISHLHPLMQEALRTGKVPERHELARLLGKNIEDIPETDGEASSRENPSEPEDPDAQAFRARYHAMVDDKINDWHDHNPYAGKSIPDTERQRIEDYCRSQIQHQWKMHRQRLAEERDT
jgi:hypothetical protein